MTNQLNLSPAVLLAVYCLLILAASLGGGVLPIWLRLTHTRMQIATSAVAGLMLGVGLLHMFTHGAESLGSVSTAVGWMLGGFLIMFFVQRFFHFHHHDVPEGDPTSCDHKQEPEAAHDHDSCGHHHDHHHHHDDQPHDHTLADKSARQVSWIGAGLGLVLHTIINGVALGASVEAESHSGAVQTLAGLGTFLVIFLHKPFDAMVITTLMAKGGRSKAARHLANACFALVIPLGVVLFHFGAASFTGADNHYIGAALAFSGGTFICIACSDLLPELQFHSHDRFKLSTAMLLGVALAMLIGKIESDNHDHDHGSGHEAETNAPAEIKR